VTGDPDEAGRRLAAGAALSLDDAALIALTWLSGDATR
jgi:hypothetical protein